MYAADFANNRIELLNIELLNIAFYNFLMNHHFYNIYILQKRGFNLYKYAFVVAKQVNFFPAKYVGC